MTDRRFRSKLTKFDRKWRSNLSVFLVVRCQSHHLSLLLNRSKQPNTIISISLKTKFHNKYYSSIFFIIKQIQTTTHNHPFSWNWSPIRPSPSYANHCSIYAWTRTSIQGTEPDPDPEVHSNNPFICFNNKP